MAEILDIARPLGEEGVGKIKDLLEIAVPRKKARVGAEHHNTIAHIVEGGAQLALTLTQLSNEPRIFDRNRRLISESRNQFDLLVSEWPHCGACQIQYADRNALTQDRNSKRRAKPTPIGLFRQGVFWIGQDVQNVNSSPFEQCSPACRASFRLDGNSSKMIHEFVGEAAEFCTIEDFAGLPGNVGLVSVA